VLRRLIEEGDSGDSYKESSLAALRLDMIRIESAIRTTEALEEISRLLRSLAEFRPAPVGITR
jgi:hypothetical protein